MGHISSPLSRSISLANRIPMGEPAFRRYKRLLGTPTVLLLTVWRAKNGALFLDQFQKFYEFII